MISTYILCCSLILVKVANIIDNPNNCDNFNCLVKIFVNKITL